MLISERDECNCFHVSKSIMLQGAPESMTKSIGCPSTDIVTLSRDLFEILNEYSSDSSDLNSGSGFLTKLTCDWIYCQRYG